MRHFKFILPFILGILLAPMTGLAQFTETKEIHKEFKVSSQTRIELSNKYGKMEINTWDKDSVVIHIKIKVEENKLSKLEKAIDAIDFDFSQTPHFLIAKTVVGQNKSGLSKEILKFKETILQSDGNMQIDYTVWLPEANELKIENKFGDIFIDDYSGDIDLHLSNGNLKSHDFTGILELALNFADATINSINTAVLNCNFSEIYIKRAEELRIKSKSTKFEILEIKKLNADSRRDNFRIKFADRIYASGSFSNFRLNELGDIFKVHADYGDIDIEKIAPDFSNISIESKSTDINLYFDRETKFDFEITHNKTDLDFCQEVEIIEERSINEKEKRIKLFGNFGGKSENKTKLNIKANSGEINILSN